MRAGMPAVPRLIACTVVASMAAFASPAAQQAGTGAALTLPLAASGTTASGTANVSGTVRVTQFVVLNNTLAAVATVVAQLSDPSAPSNVVTQVVLPVTTITATGQAGTTQQNFAPAASLITSTPASSASNTGTSFPSSNQGLYTPSVGTSPATPAFGTAPFSTITPAATTATTGMVTQVATTPVQSAAGACGPVHLEMGPLDVNDAGLVLHLDRVVVNLAAPAAALLANQATAAATTVAGSTVAGSTTTGTTATGTTATATAAAFNTGLCSVAGLVGQGQTNLQSLADQLNQVLSTLG